MKFTLTGRKIAITPAITERIEKKIGKLERLFKDEPVVNVTLSVEKDRQTIEVTIFSTGIIYRAQDTDSDLYVAIDRVVDVLERQMRKHKTHLSKKLRQGAFDSPFESAFFDNQEPEDVAEFKLVKTKKFSFNPMSVEEAILQMNMLGHQFFVFSNADTAVMSVVYKRKDGNYALIEQE